MKYIQVGATDREFSIHCKDDALVVNRRPLTVIGDVIHLPPVLKIDQCRTFEIHFTFGAGHSPEPEGE